MTPTTTTTSRLLALLSLLQARRDWPGQLLADRLGISHRTVRRDVDRLREMGYRIETTMGPDGGYHLDAGSELPPLLFDDDQAIALAVALQTAPLAGAGIEEAAGRALTTMRQVLPSRLRHRLDTVQVTTLPARSPGAAAPVTPGVLVALSAAVGSREVLRFDHSGHGLRADGAGPAAPPAPRRVEPHHVVASGGRWYLVAWDLERDDWRVFRADRITPRVPTGPRFVPRTVPGGSVRDFVSARFKGSDRGDTWPCQGRVVIHLPAADVLPFAGDGTVEDLGPERCALELGSWSWVALAASLGRFDAAVDVVGPPALAEAFGRLAERYATTASAARTAECEPRGPVARCEKGQAVQHRPRPTGQETTMTDQPGYDPAEDPDADPDQLNPRTGAAAGKSADDASSPRTAGGDVDQDAGQNTEQETDQDADPDSMNPRTGAPAHPES
ncbi:helix-turn-helix transcriptional regulator [Promicromonospora vindobonensis]|uniref:Helix-turn-helix transcriptional regulator n=1 Tax=Promicromonospora vindobonensis TaxID=195748 RepID=A0ABW5VKK9_9MICO